MADRSPPSLCGKEGFRNTHQVRPLPEGFTPGTNDVICSRGAESYNHVGNQRLREYIDLALPQYTKATNKLEKTVVVTAIVNKFRNLDGKFVRQDGKTRSKGKSSKTKWVQVGERLAREKVGQAIRAELRKKKQWKQTTAAADAVKPAPATETTMKPSPSPPVNDCSSPECSTWEDLDQSSTSDNAHDPLWSKGSTSTRSSDDHFPDSASAEASLATSLQRPVNVLAPTIGSSQSGQRVMSGVKRANQPRYTFRTQHWPVTEESLAGHQLNQGDVNSQYISSSLLNRRNPGVADPSGYQRLGMEDHDNRNPSSSTFATIESRNNMLEEQEGQGSYRMDHFSVSPFQQRQGRLGFTGIDHGFGPSQDYVQHRTNSSSSDDAMFNASCTAEWTSASSSRLEASIRRCTDFLGDCSFADGNGRAEPPEEALLRQQQRRNDEPTHALTYHRQFANDPSTDPQQPPPAYETKLERNISQLGGRAVANQPRQLGIAGIALGETVDENPTYCSQRTNVADNNQACTHQGERGGNVAKHLEGRSTMPFNHPDFWDDPHP